MAVRILASADPGLTDALDDHRAQLRQAVVEKNERLSGGS